MVASPSKITDLNSLASILERLRQDGRRIVHCHGVFDLLHVGHIRHFQQARELGDVLVVTVTPDRYVNKGPNRPAFPEQLRAEMVAAIGCVNYVAINQWPTAVEAIGLLRPHVFVKGQEFRGREDTTGHLQREEEAIRAVGGEIAFTGNIVFSSSALINEYLSPLPERTRNYLRNFANRRSAAEVCKYLAAAAELRVLVVGEAILDEYKYCEVIGKAGKEPVLAARSISRDLFAGGVLACANHLASFCKHVTLVSFLGERREHEDFISNRLRANVTPILGSKHNSPTILKQRFVEKGLYQKLFEVYEINDQPLSAAENDWMCRQLATLVPLHDLVVVADYGHGLCTPAVVDLLCRSAKFLAINTQANAANHGFNVVSKYRRADYVCLAQREYCLEMRNAHLPREELVRAVAQKLNCSRLMLTQGPLGCLSYSAEDGFHEAPALAPQVVDRIGAGDAVLCVTALGAANGAPADILAFLGSVAGAAAVAIPGNERFLEALPLYRHIECLLKMHHTVPRGDQGLACKRAA